MIEIYTDGSSKGNPGAGGWGVVMIDSETHKVLNTFNNQFSCVTNNYMELTAILAAVTELYAMGCPKATIYCDSAYALNTITDWMYRWVENGWTRGKKHEPIENLETIKAIYTVLTSEKMSFGGLPKFVKIKGHSGIEGNEMADALACNEQQRFNLLREKFERQGKS